MFDQLREGAGESYSPSASSNWPIGMASGGAFVASSAIKPEAIDRFFALGKAIATDFATRPATTDEIFRVITPLREYILRASTGNQFWIGQLMGATRDPRRIDALKTLLPDYLRITPAELQQSAARWLKPDAMFMLAVKPQASPRAAP